MPPLQFELSILGDTQVQRTFLRWQERVLDARPLWNQMRKDLNLIERVQFLTEGSHGSGGWAPLKPATIAGKKARGEEPWILRATEALFKSLTEEGADGAVFEPEREFMVFGTSIPYATFHMTGTRNMPARKPVQLTEIERTELTKMVQRFIVSGEVKGLAE
jgi:phage gpG-like protein